jgi:hypothetical protein
MKRFAISFVANAKPLVDRLDSVLAATSGIRIAWARRRRSRHGWSTNASAARRAAVRTAGRTRTTGRSTVVSAVGTRTICARSRRSTSTRIPRTGSTRRVAGDYRRIVGIIIVITVVIAIPKAYVPTVRTAVGRSPTIMKWQERVATTEGTPGPKAPPGRKRIAEAIPRQV